MSLAHVILGLLQQQQRTGYDLKTTCFDDCIAHLWQADQAQIYRTLERLESQGWVACTLEIQTDRPNRKVYQITPTGQAELAQWLQTPQPSPLLREPLLMQLHFAACLPDDSAIPPPSHQAILALLEQEYRVHQARLAACAALPAQTSATSRLQRLALDLVQRRERLYLDWLEEVRGEVRG
jgi:PadR family transcriptional regulator, regulatory protein AphA